jgi:hypothetical protein
MSKSTIEPTHKTPAPAAPVAGVSIATPAAQAPATLDVAPASPQLDPDGLPLAPDEALQEAPKDRRQRTGAPTDGIEKRKNIVDRRTGLERRLLDLGSPTGLERRRGPGRRRTDDRRNAEEGEMSDEQFEFVLAIDTYKRLNNRPFPTWTEVLEVVKQLGYRKVAASTIKLPNNNGRATQ